MSSYATATSESATKGFLTNTKYLSRPLEKCLMTPRMKTTALDTSTSSDTDNDRGASSSDSFFSCLFAQSKRRRSRKVDKVEEFHFAPPSQTVDANAFIHQELTELLIYYNTALPSSQERI